MKPRSRRIVTGHDKQGCAIFQEDGLPPRDLALGADEAITRFYEVWNTQETLARIDRASGEPEEDGIVVAPPANGTRIRIVDSPPPRRRLDHPTQRRRSARTVRRSGRG